MTDALGALRREDDRMSVRFERLYDATPAELWTALTDPKQIRGWLAEASRFELAIGGEIELRFGDTDAEVTRGRIRELEPGRVLEYDWNYTGETTSVVRFELVGQEQGTLLVLDHRHLTAEAAPGYGAGWQAHLEALAAPFSGDGDSWWHRYEELRPAYESVAAAL